MLLRNSYNFQLAFGSISTTRFNNKLGVENGHRRKPRKLAELFRKVNNLFLQVDLFARGEPWQFHTAFRDLELAAENSLA